MRKPTRMARNIAWTTGREFNWRTGTHSDAARFSLRWEWRKLDGAVGKRLLELGAAGKITFLDKTPRNTGSHVLVVGITGGLLVIYHDHIKGVAHSEVVSMCDRFRAKIVGGVGRVRWAKVKVAV